MIACYIIGQMAYGELATTRGIHADRSGIRVVVVGRSW